jgi:hypothetical protein
MQYFRVFTACPENALWCVTAGAARFNESGKINVRSLAAVYP